MRKTQIKKTRRAYFWNGVMRSFFYPMPSEKTITVKIILKKIKIS